MSFDSTTLDFVEHSYNHMMKVETTPLKQSLIFRILYYWGKLIGINSLTLSTSNKLEFSYFSLIYAAILITNYSYICYLLLNEHSNRTFPGEFPVSITVQIIVIITFYIQTVVTWLIFGFCQNRVKFIVKSFVKLEELAKRVSITENYETRFKKLGVYLAIANTVYLSSIALSHYLMAYHSTKAKILWFCYNLARMTVINAGTVFIWILLAVKSKFHRLNNQMHVIIHNDHEMKSSCNLQLSERIIITAYLHRQLRDVLDRVNNLFAFPFLFEIGAQLMALSLYLYCFTLLLKAQRVMEPDFLMLIIISYWIFISVGMLIAIMGVCSSTINEANKTGNILHGAIINNKRFGDQDAGKVDVFSFELLRNHVNMNLFGLFDLDYILCQRIIAAATMYLTIMLQFS